MSFQPLCTVIAGPNGSGKSTLFEWLPLPGEQVNADKVARQLNPRDPQAISAQAGRLVVQRLAELIFTKQSFSYETTLSGRQPLTLLAQARAAGYRTALIYVALHSAELSGWRVAQRVSQGGHDIPLSDIFRRYGRSLSNLGKAASLADDLAIFDNSGSEMVALFQRSEGAIVLDDLQLPSTLHRALRSALGLAPS